tara:strand:+ start:329 stop:883 length:555 start_codon:yes stop_codon:yes gene_type:complete
LLIPLFLASVVENQFGYRQLKLLAFNHGDYDRYAYYHLKEMQSFSSDEWKRLLKSREDVQGLSTFWKWVGLNFDYFFKVFLPSKTSNFGQKLFRPVIILVLIHMSLNFLMISVSGNSQTIMWTGRFDWPSTLKGAELFFYTLLPTHSLNFEQMNLNPIVSFLMRLVSSIFIYQIVLASRRHIKI